LPLTFTPYATTNASTTRIAPVLLVCSTGGHLAELHRLADRLDVVGNDRLWVTFDTPQARSLLQKEDRLFVNYTRPRDLTHTLANTVEALRLIRRERFSAVISTGAAIALSFLPLARAMGCRTVYIESATRTTGPSLTGRMLQCLPGVQKFTQHDSWADGKSWRYIGSVFDSFEGRPSRVQVPEVRRIVVMLGTVQGLRFRRLLDRVRQIVPEHVDVIWQVGDTPAHDIAGTVHRVMSVDQLERCVREADVVISHAGVGSALTAFASGKFPILVPREATYGEHVDDHQTDVAVDLERRGLAMCRRVDALSEKDLVTAARMTVSLSVNPPRMDTRTSQV
jgi:UDP-N-acetylglucosamine--N-acetylmuramyl-(pentapeptide) pyrophosphoryl-undecaprenol N-acetylglucosamine transferase